MKSLPMLLRGLTVVAIIFAAAAIWAGIMQPADAYPLEAPPYG